MSGKSKSKSKPKALRRRAKPLVPKWKLFRAKEPLLSVFMWGVNHTVCFLFVGKYYPLLGT